jgi:hypothetical protein
MRIASTLQSMAGVLDAAIMMGTRQNKEFLKRTFLLTEEVEATTNNDLFFVVEAESQEQADQALAIAETMLETVSSRDMRLSPETFYSLESALRKMSANLAFLSIGYMSNGSDEMPREGFASLHFCDHVPAEQVSKKTKRSGLLVMG